MSQTVEEIVERGGDVLDDVVEALHDGNEHYSWVGIYLVEGDDLVLGPWKGPEATEHVRIPVGEGICGAAAATGETEVVDDIDALGNRRPDLLRGPRRRRDRHRLGPAGGVHGRRPRLPRARGAAGRSVLLSKLDTD